MLKLIRMTLVQFIRVTYGSTINRTVRRFIVSLFQEEYVVKSLILLRDTFWPDVAPGERPTPTDDEKLERRQEAKRQLLTNIPGLFQTEILFSSEACMSFQKRFRSSSVLITPGWVSNGYSNYSRTFV